jgi:hypothetical protein
VYERLAQLSLYSNYKKNEKVRHGRVAARMSVALSHLLPFSREVTKYVSSASKALPFKQRERKTEWKKDRVKKRQRE